MGAPVTGNALTEVTDKSRAQRPFLLRSELLGKFCAFLNYRPIEGLAIASTARWARLRKNAMIEAISTG